MTNGSSQSLSSAQTSTKGCLARVTWMVLANGILMFTTVLIAQTRVFGLSVVDAIFGAGLFAALLSRYLDIRYFTGRTGFGEPATMNDWRKYAIQMAVLGLVAWCGAHRLAWYFAK